MHYATLLPDVDHLTGGLNTMFQGTEYAGCSFTVGCDENPYSSTFPSRVVACHFADGRDLRLLCKFEAGRDEGDAGHRRGLAYEAAVYRSVLQPLKAQVPRFFGAHRSGPVNQVWIALQYIDDALHAHKAESPQEAIVSACRWIGSFHARSCDLLASAPLPFLVAYDRAWYRKWARRTASASTHVRSRFPWLEDACLRFEDFLPILCDTPPAIIHGEFYPDNVLVRDGEVYPIDWQSAALAVGEIDLAVITSGAWPRDVVRACEIEYQHARWPGGAPGEFAPRLAAARIYWCMLFLGDTPETGPCEEDCGFIEEFRDAGERLGLI